MFGTLKLNTEIHLFEILKTFKPRRESLIGFILNSFNFNVSREGWLTTSNYKRKYAFYKSWKCLIPRGDSAKQNPNGVHLIRSSLQESTLPN